MEINFDREIDFGWFIVRYTIIPHFYIAKFEPKVATLDQPEKLYYFNNLAELKEFFEKIS
jgi:hypothetical protein